MIIFDEDTNRSISNITLLLKDDEALQLVTYLNSLLARGVKNEHCHLNNDDYAKEVTVTLYDKDGDIDHFAEKYKKLILSDG